MKKKFYIMLLSVSLILTATACSGGPAAPAMEEEKPVAVETAVVGKASVEAVSTMSGKVKPNQEISIVPKVPGKVSGINAHVGQRVKQGDLLLSLDAADIRQQINQAEAGLSIAESSYNSSKTNYENSKKLYELGAVSKMNYDSAESAYKVAGEQYKSSKAAYELAKSQLNNTQIKSPIDGIVASLNTEVGEMVSSAISPVMVVDISSVKVDITVPESMVNKVKKGDDVDVLVSAVSSEPIKGQVESVSPTADSRTQSYPVSITISNNNEALKGGMFAEVRLKADNAEDSLAVSLSSVVDEKDKKYVYVVNGDRVEKREIKSGLVGENIIQILDGLKENEVIVVKGQNFLSDGSLVNIVNK